MRFSARRRRTPDPFRGLGSPDLHNAQHPKASRFPEKFLSISRIYEGNRARLPAKTRAVVLLLKEANNARRRGFIINFSGVKKDEIIHPRSFWQYDDNRSKKRDGLTRAQTQKQNKENTYRDMDAPSDSKAAGDAINTDAL